jgi:uncharacterized repeat protein (TIGR03803 family)
VGFSLPPEPRSSGKCRFTGCASPGRGTFFSLTHGGSESVLHSFGGGSDGEGPQGTIVNVNGRFYGITKFGGANNLGTIYSLTP